MQRVHDTYGGRTDAQTGVTDHSIQVTDSKKPVSEQVLEI